MSQSEVASVPAPGTQGDRPRIGLLLHSAEDDYEVGILRGVVQAASTQQVQLVTFAGQELLDQLGERSLDGLIVLTAALSHHIGLPPLHALLTRFAHIPRCAVGLKVGNAPALLVDNEVGMAELIEHLIVARKYRRIAFIQGPQESEEAARRFFAYKATLAKHGIQYDPQLVVPGDFLWRSGEFAVQTLFGERGFNARKLDAIVAADDVMALGAIQTLQRRDVRVPQDLAVAGFDDVPLGRRCDPPLTTVRQPLEQIGAEALAMVLRQLGGAAVQDRTFPTKLVIRRSCGKPDAVAHAVPEATGTSLRDHAASLVARIENLATGLGPLGEDWAAVLVDSLVRQLEGKAPEAFRGKYEEFLHVLSPLDVDLEVFHDILKTLRETVEKLVTPGSPHAIAAEALFLDLGQRTGMAVERAVVRRRARAELASVDMRAASAELLKSFDLEEFGAALERNLPRLRIERLFIAQRLPVESGAEPLAEVLIAYDASSDDVSQPSSAPRGSLPPPTAKVRLLPGIRFPAANLLPSEHSGDFKPQLVKPLTFGDATLGFATFSLGARDPFAYEMLRQVLSVFLRGYQLTRENEALALALAAKS